MDFYLKIAGLPFHIIGWEQPMPDSLQEYLCEVAPDAFPVVITDETRAFERAEAESAAESFPAETYEFLCAIRQIAKAIIPQKRMFMHGAAIAFRGRGFFFTAPSGTGKTTHIRLWHRYLGSDVQIINGDKPVLSFGEQITVSGSPWAGKEGYQQNSEVPLEAVILLKRGTINEIYPVSPEEALPFLYSQIFLIDEPESAPYILEYLDRLLLNVPVYELHCTMSEESLRCSFETLTNLDYESCKKKELS